MIKWLVYEQEIWRENRSTIAHAHTQSGCHKGASRHLCRTAHDESIFMLRGRAMFPGTFSTMQSPLC